MVQLLPWGSNIDQLFIPVQENHREAELLSNITGQSYLRECRRLGIIRQQDDPSATFFHRVFVDLHYRELPQQDEDEAEHQDAGTMSVDSNGMSIVL
jgi:hypothetical protein